jgi:hypothetical protein
VWGTRIGGGGKDLEDRLAWAMQSELERVNLASGGAWHGDVVSDRIGFRTNNDIPDLGMHIGAGYMRWAA